MRDPTDMEKRVAQAICNFSGKCQCVAFLAFDATTCADVLVLARGAIQAMREPTGKMLDAGRSLPDEGGSPPLEEVWQAMIDAASPEK